VVLDNGPVEDPSAICHLGRGQVGCSASGEVSEEVLVEVSGEVSDWGATPMSAPASHGSPEGGGQTQAFTAPQATDMVIQGTGTIATSTPTRLIRSTPIQDISKQTKGGRGYVVA